MLHGDREGRLALFDKYGVGTGPRQPLLLDVHEAFVRVQESMADLLEHINSEARAAGKPIPMYPEGFDREALRQEREPFPSGLNFADLRLEFALECFGNSRNIEAIIESAATAASSGAPTLTTIVSWNGRTLRSIPNCRYIALASHRVLEQSKRDCCRNSFRVTWRCAS
jgi:hypothetical protein